VPISDKSITTLHQTGGCCKEIATSSRREGSVGRTPENSMVSEPCDHLPSPRAVICSQSLVYMSIMR